MLGLDKLGPGSILVVLIAGGWLTAWAEWARVRVAVQACGCLVTLAGLWRSGIMVRLGPGPTCSPSRLKPGASGRCPPGPAEYVVSHFRPGPPGSGFGCVTFLSGRHESDTGPIGRGCYWAWATRPSPWSSGEARSGTGGLVGE